MASLDYHGGEEEELREHERAQKLLEESFVDPLLRLDYDSDEEDLIPSIEDVLGRQDPDASLGMPDGSLQQMTAQGTVPSKARWLASIDRHMLPASYRSNAKKEELCIQYADDFQR